MRRGELVGLRWTDVNLHGERINVRRQITSTDYIVRHDEPKSPTAARGRDYQQAEYWIDLSPIDPAPLVLCNFDEFWPKT